MRFHVIKVGGVIPIWETAGSILYAQGAHSYGQCEAMHVVRFTLQGVTDIADIYMVLLLDLGRV